MLSSVLLYPKSWIVSLSMRNENSGPTFVGDVD